MEEYQFILDKWEGKETKGLFLFGGGHVYRWLRNGNDITLGEYRIVNNGTLEEWPYKDGCYPLIDIYERIY